jgi:hypothetical protein
MFRVSVFVFLACAIAKASPLPCALDVFQPANTSDALNWIGYGYSTSVSDVSGGTTSWLAPVAMSSDLYSDDNGVGADEDSSSQPVIPFDLSRFCVRPLIIEVDINA